ncbi:uncharacterized protein LOC116431953 [Nomia melanderi]|uniref:uncharacterized protein LOC116431953 n=1 Tax=Nomia melanderi TaxID=2448451 RepID=UPI0013041546|nr:mitochondrial fission regulator 2-like [Nomia melanderi]XP_031843985.1 mitochondrial fission regulator 2-like [Nomia melanderi]XP_031843986.1 mitochondrial fission regulator 2-like [Nomia melanderi]
MCEPPKYYGKRRSIVRRIGSLLPLKPPPKIYVSVTPLHSMSSSMINEETSSDCKDTNGFGQARFSNVRPDLLEPISFGSEVRLLALEQELQELREQVSAIVKSNKQSRYTSTASLVNGTNTDNVIQTQSPPPPPPPPPPPLSPLPPPTTPHIARRASLQDHKVEEHKRIPLNSQASISDVFKSIEGIQLNSVAKSPRGRSLHIKRENSPCNDLQEILRRRYIAMNSDNSRNSTINLTMDDSFSSDT